VIGVDLPKDPERLIRAYDDSEGVTAAFNLNLLRRINRELGGDFDLTAFAHEARWNAGESRVEMHLRSLRAQRVEVLGRAFAFAEGETIHTENSHKFSVEAFRHVAARRGGRRSTSGSTARRSSACMCWRRFSLCHGQSEGIRSRS
jgi:uncharacterized SAM-dependent methyltransferase